MAAKPLAATAMAMALGLALAACGTDSKPEPTQQPKPAQTIPYSTVWSADPGVDLFSRDAELVRAAIESARYTTFVGVDQSYPGYARAVSDLTERNEHSEHPDLGTKDLVARQPVFPGQKMQPGTHYEHITAYHATDTKISAIVCAYSVGTEPATPNQTVRILGGGARLELGNTAAAPGVPGIANRDADHHDPRAQLPPQWDVFGSWKVTAISDAVNPDNYAPECLPWYQQQFPEFTKDPAYNRLVAPQGFVAPHHPPQPQYPEWIKPT